MRTRRRVTEEKKKKPVSKSLLDLYEFDPGTPPKEYDWKRMVVIYVSIKGRAIRKAYYIASKDLFVAADGVTAGRVVQDVFGWALDPREEA